MSEWSADSIVLASTCTAAIVFSSAIVMFQIDAVSRRVLSPSRLYAKRRLEQLHRLQSGIVDGISNIRQFVNGGEVYDAKVEERAIADIVLGEEGIRRLVGDIVGGTRSSAPVIVGLAIDVSDNLNGQEWYLHLAFPTDSAGSAGYGRRIKTSLVKFGQACATAFQQKLTSTALCFVADASSGLGTDLLTRLLTDTLDDGHFPLVKEAVWMTSFARLLELNLITTAKLERVFFGLCRLEALRAPTNAASRTVVFTLPGQGCTANLLPLIYKVFPCERHVFAYDGCVDSVIRACSYTTHSINTGHEIPPMPKSVTANIPISPNLYHSIPHFKHALAKLSSRHAGPVEAWMSSVDALLNIKTSTASKNHKTRKDGAGEEEFAPFVCRMGFLTGDFGRLGNGDTDQSKIALVSILQYITGSRSRPLKEEVVTAAVVSLASFLSSQKQLRQISTQERKAIEECVFSHRGILIGDKTLVDTVQPKKNWSLKAAKKMTSCACCAPLDQEEYSDVEDDDNEKNSDEPGIMMEAEDPMMGQNQRDLTVPGAFATNVTRRTTKASSNSNWSSGANRDVTKPLDYVDGKMRFAFDPSKYS